MDQTVEQWRPVVGYEGFYEVSNLGRVRSLDRVAVRGDGVRCRQRSLVLKQSICGRLANYYKVGLSKNGQLKTRNVAKLVADAFLGPRPEGTEIAHGPGGSLDNSVANLSYKTRSDNNLADKLRDGTDKRGEKHENSKLNRHQVLFARKMNVRKRGHLPQLAKAWGVSPSTLREAVAGLSWGWL